MGEKVKLTRAIEQVERLCADLTRYHVACEEARSWGGPTIYPRHPITEQRALSDAKALAELTGVVRAALEGAPDAD